MTTIAYRKDQGIVAADTLIKHGSVKSHGKKLAVGDQCVFACSGNMDCFAPFLRWYNAGADPLQKPRMEDEAHLSVFHVDGRVEGYCAGVLESYEQIPEWGNPYFAYGSGREAALAAMMCGRSAFEAVRIAAAIDVDSGGWIQYVNLWEFKAGNIPALKFLDAPFAPQEDKL